MGTTIVYFMFTPIYRLVSPVLRVVLWLVGAYIALSGYFWLMDSRLARILSGHETINAPLNLVCKAKVGCATVGACYSCFFTSASNANTKVLEKLT